MQLERDVREDVSRLSPMECFQLNLAAALDSGASLMTIQEDFEGFSVADFDQLVPILKKAPADHRIGHPAEHQQLTGAGKAGR